MWSRHLQRLPREQRDAIGRNDVPGRVRRSHRDECPREDPRVRDLRLVVVCAAPSDVHVHAESVLGVPEGYLRPARRQLRRSHRELRQLSCRTDLRRWRHSKRMRRRGWIVHAGDVRVVRDRHLRRAEQRVRWRHCKLRVPRGSNLRRRWRSRKVRRWTDVVRAAHLCGVSQRHLRSADRRLRWTDSGLFTVPRGTDLRRLRCRRTMLHSAEHRMHAASVPGEHQVRPH